MLRDTVAAAAAAPPWLTPLLVQVLVQVLVLREAVGAGVGERNRV